jgi:hypothetical protein
MAHTYLDNLLNVLLPFAKQQLEKSNSFYPYAAQVENGQVIMVNVHLGEEYPDSNLLIDQLDAIFSEAAESGKIQAAGICLDATISDVDRDKTDAIQIDLEHKNGESLRIYVPYVRKADWEIVYGELFTQSKDLVWFKK